MNEEDKNKIYEIRRNLINKMPQEGETNRELLDLLDMVIDILEG